MTMIIEKIYELLKQNNFNFCTDTRKIKEGDVFFALKGDNFNGNQYALKALESKASFAIIDDASLAENENLILVDDVLSAFQQLARWHRIQLNKPVIAIAGSNGKTTTKELTALVLSKVYKTHVTPGNFNNHIGLPITLLSCPIDAQVILLEMGANHQGEIAELCEIAMPNYGLITNIGKEHLEGFGSIEGVAKAESELYQYLLANNGKILVNMNDAWLSNMTKRFKQYYGYGHPSSDNFYAGGKLLRSSPTIEAEIEGIRFTSVLMGDYNFDNILAAVTIGKLFGVDINDIQEAISNYTPQNNRSQIIETDKNWLLLDAYNANPSSMELALKNFALSKANNKTIILGDMFELGKHADFEHKQLIELIKKLGLTSVYLAGSFFYQNKKDDGFLYFEDYDSLLNYLLNNALVNRSILIKGSRGMALERLLSIL
jgi:UDP-N-acetylmuramoyl-tripeptide--D-alanyl-D-alanine ligase